MKGARKHPTQRPVDDHQSAHINRRIFIAIHRLSIGNGRCRIRRGQLSPDAGCPGLTHVKLARAARRAPGSAKNTAAPACEARPPLTGARREPHWNTDPAAPFGRPFAYALLVGRSLQDAVTLAHVRTLIE
ncbi:hypothetical protein GPU89_08280 [Burkholderia cepacia]|nr:hypothetical protein [Burkholderia cepacia]